MYLIINLGLKSLRSIVLKDNGKVISSNSRIVNTRIKNNFVEQDANNYKKILHQLLSDISKKDLSNKIKFISVTTSANCLLGLSKQFKPVTKVLTVLDFRANEEKFQKILKKKKIFLDPSHNLSKIIWLKYFDKKNFYKSSYWINNSDYLTYLFTGKLYTDPLNFSKFYFRNQYLSKNILRKFNIKKIVFPELKEIGSNFNIKNSLIKKYNFSKDCRFILTTYDAICACLGSLNHKNLYNNACEVSGTVTSFRYLSKKKPKSVKGLKISYIPLIQHYVIGLSNNLGGGIIEWYKSFLNKTNYYKKLKDSYNKGNNYFYFFPFIFGDRNLAFRETSRGIFFGLGSNTNIHDMSKGVVDSVCFVSKYLFDRLSLSKKKFNTITLSGGLTRIDFINFLKSSLFKTKVYTCTNFESTTLGCLILMLISSTQRKFSDVIKIIKLKEVKKNKKLTIDINSKYLFFKDFLKKNKKLFSIYDRTLIKENPHFRNL